MGTLVEKWRPKVAELKCLCTRLNKVWQPKHMGRWKEDKSYFKISLHRLLLASIPVSGDKSVSFSIRKPSILGSFYFPEGEGSEHFFCTCYFSFFLQLNLASMPKWHILGWCALNPFKIIWREWISELWDDTTCRLHQEEEDVEKGTEQEWFVRQKANQENVETQS